jgi:hypothetical protein
MWRSSSSIRLTESLPSPPFAEDEKQTLAHRVYEYVWQRYVNKNLLAA